ncbi:hypothetical protein BCR43DRAFT_490212 [Syncephalastrum racemosum]|uniref:Uncharacterized protein n=1 Tax=Syncephalastrum racemosum TaxID=13706 RepID=A0A1X2HFJ4_SYNRA|nr:hypothetical protein BCR43DRAFT_490212 [Syncephalastrum racemosum]
MDTIPKGERATKLDHLNTKFTEKIVWLIGQWQETIHFDDSRRDEEWTQSIAPQMRDFAAENLLAEYEKVLQTRQVVEKLNKLDEMAAEAQKLPSKSRRVPQPRDVYRALRMKAKEDEMTRLIQEEHELNQKNNALIRDLAEKKEELARLRKGSVADCEDFMESLRILDDFMDPEDLSRLTAELSTTRQHTD